MNKKKWTMLGCAGILAAVIFMPVKSNAQEIATYAIVEENTINPMGAQQIWVYKNENGKKYRRLWDAKYKKWLTDWILCG